MNFSTRPKQLFLVDGLGALLSAFLLGVVLVHFENFFGIPKQMLYFLAILPCFFAIYDFYCYGRIKQNIGRFLWGIAIVNLLYCALSLRLASYHFEKITFFGWGYILGEIALVIILATIELKTANRIMS